MIKRPADVHHDESYSAGKQSGELVTPKVELTIQRHRIGSTLFFF